MKLKRYRTFLTSPDEADSYITVSEDYGINLKIADCSRSVGLYFNKDTPIESRKSLRKLEKIEKVLMMIRENLEGSLEGN